MIKPLLATACAVLLLAACDSREPAQTFTFTAIPDQDESRLEQRFGKVAEHLEEALGVPVKYVPVKSYPAAVTAFRNDEVQMAWFGGLSGVQARRLVPGSQAIAQGQEDTAFKSYFIANSSTGIPKTTATQNRCVMLLSSVSSSFSIVDTYFGSSSIPHFGQVPGSFCSTSGCIGQV